MTRQDMINEHMRYEWRSGLKPLTKLDALRILASAYHYLRADLRYSDLDACILRDKFGYVRRSMTLDDLKPEGYRGLEIETIIVDEGYNGRGPTWL